MGGPSENSGIGEWFEDIRIGYDEDASWMSNLRNCCFIRQILHSVVMFRTKCGGFVNDMRIQFFIIGLICLNAIMMGIGTFDFVTENPTIDEIFETVDKCFLYIFTVELILQLIYEGFYFVYDGWLVFDFFIIITSFTMADAQIVRAFRILRALRLVSRVQTMKDIVVCLLSVIPRMLAICALLALIMYIFGVMFTTLFKTTYDDDVTSHDYFGTLEDSAFTLFQVMTMDSWAEICREVMEVYWWAWIPFLAYVILSAFIVVNLVIAVICDAIADVNDDNEDQLNMQAEMKISLQAKDLYVHVAELEIQIDDLIEAQIQTQSMIDELSKKLPLLFKRAKS